MTDIQDQAPEGYTIIAFRQPISGEIYLKEGAIITAGSTKHLHQHLILKRNVFTLTDGCTYWRIDMGNNCVEYARHKYKENVYSNFAHNIGNYFQTQKGAEAAWKQITAMLLDLKKEPQ